jgi:type VI secretion system secreted protein Hcp
MAINAYLKIDGIEGASTVKGHKGEIDVLAFSWGISNSSTATGGGGGAGKPQVQDFAFSKELAQDSPELFVSVCKGEHHEGALLTVEGVGSDPKGQSKSFYKVKFTDVLISSVSLGGSEGSVPQENVTLNFGKVEIEFRGPKGGSKVEVCDFVKGTTD